MRSDWAVLLVLALLCADGQLVANEAARPSVQTVREWQNHKYGMFIHFGLYSMLGGVWRGKQYSGNYSEQIQSDAQIPEAEYSTLAKQFNPTQWDPEAIVRLAQDAGMQFIVLTSKHHDGFSLFDTKASTFNSVKASPYAKDLVKSLADACARHHMPFGVYYSTIDWHFGDVRDRKNDNPISQAHEKFNVAQLQELTTKYGPLSEIWFDMGHPTKLQSEHFAATVHKNQPETMISGRVWNSQGDFMEMGDDEIPDYILDEPWESPASIFKETWGYRSWQQRTSLDEKTREHIQRLVAVVSRGGNYILNIGPKGDGSVVDYEAQVLRGAGTWLKRNRDAIYGTQPQPFRKLDFGYATVQGNRLFLFVEHVGADGQLKLPGLKNRIRNAYVLGDAQQHPLAVRDEPDGKSIAAPASKDFLPVAVVEFEGALTVEQPAVLADAEGRVTLTSADADHFYNANGEGYYDPPTLRKERWTFRVKRSGRYRVEISYKSGKFSRLLNVDIDGNVLPAIVYGNEKPATAVAGIVELKAARNSDLSIAPALPSERGAALGFDLVGVTLAPVGN